MSVLDDAIKQLAKAVGDRPFVLAVEKRHLRAEDTNVHIYTGNQGFYVTVGMGDVIRDYGLRIPLGEHLEEE